MQHSVDGRAWKKFDTKYPDFAKEPRNVRLGLAADGFNPFGNLSQAYSMCLYGWSGQGYKACPACNKDTLSVHVLSKTAYVGHKRFLKKPHKWRSSLEFNGETDNRDPPKEFGRDEILAQLDRLPTKAYIKVVDILCDLELIYPPALFDIMIHLVIHLPLEAIEGGPICLRWMYPFERYMKKLKGYVRNKAKPEGSIAEGYVAEEALTFSSHYFLDVTTKFNSPDRNVDPPPPACQFQKVKWYVLHNSPEIDTYRSQFKSLFPNKDMKEEFPDWFGSQIRQRHVDNDEDPEVSTTSELFSLAYGPTWTPISINSCIVDGVRYVVHSRDERCTTQNSGICSPGPDGEMYYGQL
nr:hypothetical protein [Tanacetum cinerariifolium]